MSLADALSQPDRTAEALRAAQLYYVQDLTMEAIAEELHTSRSSVSRLLGYARESGLVDIQVRSPHDIPSRLEAEFRDRFGVTAHIVPVPDHTSDIDRLERVALSAARFLGSVFDSNMTLGLAWGSTVSAVARHLTPKRTHNSQIVQLNGAANTRTSGILYASEILHRYADAYGAYAQQFAVPAFFDDPSTKLALWRERSIRRVLEIQRRMDVALFGLGSQLSGVPSHVYVGGYLDDSDFEALASAGAVGDVATVFFRADGSWRDIPFNNRASGPDLDVLRGVSRRICVVAGAAKVPPLLGALAGGLISDLVVDEGTARAAIDQHDAQR